MKTKFQSTKVLKVLGLIVVCAFNLSSPYAVVSVFADSSEKIIFTIDDGQGDIYTMDPDGSNLTNITNTPTFSECYPRWSPDATKISFSCGGDIWIMNTDGCNRTNLTQTPGFHEEYHSWSPDGCQIAYGRHSGHDGRIYVMNSDGTNHIELTSGQKVGHPSWSPDGTRIAFQRDLKPGQAIGHRQIYVMNSDGTDVHRIVFTDGEDFDPAWSPDGTRILFLSNRGGNVWRNQIYVGDFSIGPDGIPRLLNETNITNNEWRQGFPQWSPDGSRIVYCRAPYLTHDHDVWVSNADGSGLVQLTNTPGIIDSSPHWAIVNQPPVADAGPDQTVEQESYDGTQVTLDGSGSTDPDSTPGTNDDIVSFGWYEGATPLGNGEILDYTFSLGEHIVTLVVTDSCGETDDDVVTITVVDTTPPDILLDDPEPSVLWPPNHKFVDVVILGIADDICDVGLDIDVSVEVLDAEGGDGGPNHDPDYEVICAGIVDRDVGIIVSLRAESSGKGDGRVYRITATVTDASGNITTGTVDVTVPHDQGKGKK